MTAAFTSTTADDEGPRELTPDSSDKSNVGSDSSQTGAAGLEQQLTPSSSEAEASEEPTPPEELVSVREMMGVMGLEVGKSEFS